MIRLGRLSAQFCIVAAFGLSCGGPELESIDDSMLGVAVTNSGFYFYPPWGVMTTAPQDWSSDVYEAIEVNIDEVDANGVVTRHLRTLSSVTTPRLLRHTENEAYGVGWDSNRDTFVDNANYRITVSAGGAELGHSDLDPRWISHLRNKSSLWIKFRVERAGVDGDGDGVFNWDDHCPSFADASNPIPGEEVCDGVDNNCSGTIDENNPGAGVACSTQHLGICGTGVTRCDNGTLVCDQDLAPSSEVCDGVDNDCDGASDENDPSGGDTCTTGQQGVCTNGTTHCTNGNVVCQRNVQPVDELCDTLDNNCNGATDEGDPGGGISCPTGQVGVCANGTTHCLAGAVSCVRNVAPTAEACDGLDNNCNGASDENNPGGGVACATGQWGVCSPGITACTSGALVCNRNTAPSTEVCDNLDNDCDNTTDEGDPGGNVACSTGQLGVCAGGTTHCTSGAVVCTRNIVPTVESCDSLDNNCNGSTDEGDPGGGSACATGLLGVCSTGIRHCVGGALVCQAVASPTTEVCDGVDNDCDGLVDEGNPGAGSCTTGQSGVCSAGTRSCTNGALVCTRNVAPSTEVCDGLDNDCDASTDEGNPGGNVACTTGQSGVCSPGTTSCTSGALVCNRTTAPSSETCDNLDNDCNGTVDNGASATCTAPSNGTGTCTSGQCLQACNSGYHLVGASCVADHGSTTISYTGNFQTWTVPAGVTRLTIDMSGGQGGNGVCINASTPAQGGRGGRVQAELPVVAGQVLQVNVGGQGATNPGGPSFGNGGPSSRGNFNTNYWGGGGGGASDIRRDSNSNGTYAFDERLLVAGGGGGGGGGCGFAFHAGGAGGLTGGNGATSPCGAGGRGATTTAGGASGTSGCGWNLTGSAGTLGIGGTGQGTSSAQGFVGGGNQGGGGGGGGGGRYGGGGGNGDGTGNGGAAGGGGGSSYADPTATNVVHTTGSQTGVGTIIISW